MSVDKGEKKASVLLFVSPLRRPCVLSGGGELRSFAAAPRLRAPSGCAPRPRRCRSYHGCLPRAAFRAPIRLSQRTLWDIVRPRLASALLLLLLMGASAALIYYDFPMQGGASSRWFFIAGMGLLSLSYLLSGMLKGGRCTQPWLEDILPQLLSGSSFDTTSEVFSTRDKSRKALGEDWDAKTKRELLKEPKLYVTCMLVAMCTLRMRA